MRGQVVRAEVSFRLDDAAQPVATHEIFSQQLARDHGGVAVVETSRELAHGGSIPYSARLVDYVKRARTVFDIEIDALRQTRARLDATFAAAVGPIAAPLGHHKKSIPPR